ncbi:prolidase, partial [Macrolepiota fuliginosa MF-IS2]
MGYQAQTHVHKTFEQLLALLPESDRAKPQILLVAGEVTGYRNDTDRELLFRQESNFFYLTGCNVPSAYLLASYRATRPNGTTSAPTTTLFIPKAEQADIMWSIPPPDLADARTLFDATTIEHPASFPEVIATILKASPDALVHTLPKGSPLFPQLPAHFLSNFSTPTTDQYLLPALQRVRLIKDADEIALIRKANAISSRAHETVMRVLGLAVKNKIAREEGAGVKRPLLPGEWLIEREAEAEAIFVASCRREGSIHQAYLPIVAASTRAATLHYCCNDKELAWGPVGPTDHLNNQSLTVPPSHPHPHVSTPHTTEIQPQVLLIDAGCEYTNYASDITRTMPVGNSGRFTSTSGAIYDLVHAMQAAAFGLIKPGVHWDRVHLECHRVLIRGFLALGLFNGGSEEEILKSGVSGAFFPHGLGHSLGMDVHDVPEASKPAKNPTVPKEDVGNESFYAYLRLRLLLEVGMVVTVEPGVYFHPHLIAPVLGSKYIDLEVLKKYESVGGVRIEDVIVITQNGYENLTTVRSERSWIEGVCSG